MYAFVNRSFDLMPTTSHRMIANHDDYSGSPIYDSRSKYGTTITQQFACIPFSLQFGLFFLLRLLTKRHTIENQKINTEKPIDFSIEME